LKNVENYPKNDVYLPVSSKSQSADALGIEKTYIYVFLKLEVNIRIFNLFNRLVIDLRWGSNAYYRLDQNNS